MRRALVAVLAFVLVSCDPLARTELRLTFDETGQKVDVAIVADTDRVKDMRAATGDAFGEDIFRARDEWSIRLRNSGAEKERIILDRTRGELTRVEQHATIDADDLQRFFDTGVSVQVTRGSGWAEVTFYPGASSRATRQQRSQVAESLDAFARLAANYYETLAALYRHLDANPSRSEPLFQALFEEKENQRPEMSEQESDLVSAVRTAAESLWKLEEADNKKFARDADFVFNPFPGRLDVVVPSEPLLVEGFRKNEDGILVASTSTPLEALRSLAGTWASPDPLALSLVEEKVTVEDVTAAPRKVEAVDAASIRRKVMEAMQPAPRYRVRFVTKSDSSS
jgi:hypothetical protein